jgi:hypothetical protein
MGQPPYNASWALLLLLTAGIIFVCLSFAIEGFRTGGFGFFAPASSQNAGQQGVTAGTMR